MTNQGNNQSIIPSTDAIQLTSLTLKMTTAQVVETSVTVNNKQCYSGQRSPGRSNSIYFCYVMWITAELRQKMRKRDFLENQAVKQNSHQAWNNYKKARNEVNQGSQG